MRTVTAALVAAFLCVGCASSLGWRPGQCVRVVDIGPRATFLIARIESVKESGVIVLLYENRSWGDDGREDFDPFAEKPRKRLLPCSSEPFQPITVPDFPISQREVNP